MSVVVMLAIAGGIAVVFSTLSILGLRGGEEKPSGEAIAGAILQSSLLGLIIGFLLVPNLPAPPPLGGAGFLWFVGAIVLIEITRNGLLVHVPIVRRWLCRYRLAALRSKQRSIARSIDALERLAAR